MMFITSTVAGDIGDDVNGADNDDDNTCNTYLYVGTGQTLAVL